MAYTKTNWVNDTTPITADNLNNIENGISNLQPATTQTTSNDKGYSCSYINDKLGKVLYENASGSASEITLSDNITNYSKIDVYVGWYNTYGFDDYGISKHSIDLSVTKNINISYNLVGSSWGMLIFHKWTFNNNKLTPKAKKIFNTNGSTYIDDTNTRIMKVIGYK